MQELSRTYFFRFLNCPPPHASFVYCANSASSIDKPRTCECTSLSLEYGKEIHHSNINCPPSNNTFRSRFRAYRERRCFGFLDMSKPINEGEEPKWTWISYQRVHKASRDLASGLLCLAPSVRITLLFDVIGGILIKL